MWQLINSLKIEKKYFYILQMSDSINKIENGTGEYVKEITTVPKNRQQPKAINGSSMQ